MAYHLHGITATLWMMLLVAQPLLHRLGRWDVHRRLGRLGFLLVPAVVLGGLVMVHRMLTMKNRRDMQLHARYMVGTVFGVLVPALTRAFIVFGGVATFELSLHLSYVAVYAVIVSLLVHDVRSGGVRLPYALALGLMIVQHAGMSFAPTWSAWLSLMDTFAGLGAG